MQSSPSQINTHLYLVSGRAATSNITPALDQKTQPDKVFLMVSPDKQQQAANLQQVLVKDARVQVEIFEIEDSWDIDHIRTRTMELLESLDADEHIALNATGGTRVMSMACFEVFRAYEYPVFYVHPFTDRLTWLYPVIWPSHDLADKAKLQHFLPAHGATLEGRGNVSVLPSYRRLTQTLINHIDSYHQPIRTLNWYAHRAKQADTLVVALEQGHKRWLDFQNLLELFLQAGVLEIQRNQLCFVDEDARFFANGGWLEQHVYALVMEVRKKNPTIQDFAQSVEVSRLGYQGKAIHNELDVVVLADNHLHIIECKTKKFDHVPDKQHSSGSDTLYKLDTLQELYGGLQAKSMLVSYLPVSPADKRRAQDLQIKVCDAQQLRNLRSQLSEWLR